MTTTTPPSGVQGIGGTATPTPAASAGKGSNGSGSGGSGSSSNSGSSTAGNSGSAVSAASGTSDSSDDQLAFTGSDAPQIAALSLSGVLFLILGTAFVLVSWKRRTNRSAE